MFRFFLTYKLFELIKREGVSHENFKVEDVLFHLDSIVIVVVNAFTFPKII